MEFIINCSPDSHKGYPIHKHDQYEIIFYLNGIGHMHTFDHDYEFGSGNIIIIPPNTFHASYSKEGFKSIYLRGEFDRYFNLQEPVYLKDNERSEARQLALIALANRFGDADYLTALCTSLIHYMLKNLKFVDNIGAAVSRLMDSITDSFHDSALNLSALLCESGYAEDYIRAHFKRITQKTPVEFLTDIRIKHACFLMEVYGNSASLSEIAEQCGFTDYVYFSKRFKAINGISPSEYKTKIRQN